MGLRSSHYNYMDCWILSYPSCKNSKERFSPVLLNPVCLMLRKPNSNSKQEIRVLHFELPHCLSRVFWQVYRYGKHTRCMLSLHKVEKSSSSLTLTYFYAQRKRDFCQKTKKENRHLSSPWRPSANVPAVEWRNSPSQKRTTLQRKRRNKKRRKRRPP